MTQISRQLHQNASESPQRRPSKRVSELPTTKEHTDTTNESADRSDRQIEAEKEQSEEKDWSSDAARKISRNKYLIKFREIDKHRPSQPSETTESVLSLVDTTRGKVAVTELSSESKTSENIESKVEPVTSTAEESVKEEAVERKCSSPKKVDAEVKSIKETKVRPKRVKEAAPKIVTKKTTDKVTERSKKEIAKIVESKRCEVTAVKDKIELQRVSSIELPAKAKRETTKAALKQRSEASDEHKPKLRLKDTDLQPSSSTQASATGSPSDSSAGSAQIDAKTSSKVRAKKRLVRKSSGKSSPKTPPNESSAKETKAVSGTVAKEVQVARSEQSAPESKLESKVEGETSPKKAPPAKRKLRLDKSASDSGAVGHKTKASAAPKQKEKIAKEESDGAESKIETKRKLKKIESSVLDKSNSLDSIGQVRVDERKGVESSKQQDKRIRFREYNINDFDFLSVLGHGGWGFVILAELRGHDTCFAIKCIKKITIVEDDDFDSIMIERKMLTLGNINPFICKLFCTFETEVSG